MRAPVKRVVVNDTAERLQALGLGSDDLLLAGSIERLDTVAAEEFTVEVELAQEPGSNRPPALRPDRPARIGSGA